MTGERILAAIGPLVALAGLTAVAAATPYPPPLNPPRAAAPAVA